ncbi:hypothetical protein CALCODRAFT_490149 [Calocera cornea HHB12733]|uniref:Uncharacterized protein n=1 Tax=Calocera cornea HHB12733 TaxID=1353952 RepID=A0A165JVY5_9BASI|nr:hypothetical protein CALCODRAFT_490149 [Calocera cornea HHB12733]
MDGIRLQCQGWLATCGTFVAFGQRGWRNYDTRIAQFCTLVALLVLSEPSGSSMAATDEVKKLVSMALVDSGWLVMLSDWAYENFVEEDDTLFIPLQYALLRLHMDQPVALFRRGLLSTIQTTDWPSGREPSEEFKELLAKGLHWSDDLPGEDKGNFNLGPVRDHAPHQDLPRRSAVSLMTSALHRIRRGRSIDTFTDIDLESLGGGGPAEITAIAITRPIQSPKYDPSAII